MSPVWHPDAKRVQYADAGTMLDVPARGVLHTTEGHGLPTYSGSAPHFTLNPATGDLWQHIAINRCAKALKNLGGGVETNRANAIQIEMIGFAKDTPNWPKAHYREVADLMRWVERNGGVKRRSGVKFVAGRNTLSHGEWMNYSGWCGHQHVPENDHWDPGAFRIDDALELDADPYRHLNIGDTGQDVVVFQQAVNRIARRCCRDDHKIAVDGDFGPLTLKHGAWACWLIGMGKTQAQVAEGGIGPLEQTYAADYDARSDAVKELGARRRARHCKCKEV